MSAISTDLLNTVNNTGAGATSSSTSATDAQQDQFLKLLVTQLQNQDPLNPMDNAAVTTQLAQLSTVSGINQLNTTLNSYVSSMQSSQSVQATAMIGHTVLTDGNNIQLSSSKGVFALNIPSTTDTVTATISDSKGNVVRTLALGKQAAGTPSFSWDGTNNAGTTVADGSYSYTVKASLGGKAVAATTLSYGDVASVSNSSTGALLNISNLGSVSLDKVIQVF